MVDTNVFWSQIQMTDARTPHIVKDALALDVKIVWNINVIYLIKRRSAAVSGVNDANRG